MNMGARRANAQSHERDHERNQERDDWIGTAPIPEEESFATSPVDERFEPERRAGSPALAVLLILLGLGWLGAAAWTRAHEWRTLDVAESLQLVSFLSPPLILLGLCWLLFGRTTRRETERFTRAVSEMQNESRALENILAIVSGKIEENHSKLRDEAAKLMSLGDEASDRLGRVTYYLAKEGAHLDRKSEALEAAAANARIDLGVLLQDLPRAEEQARAVSEAMREAGLTAHGQAGALEGQLSALLARSREADEVVGGAAQRLAAHLARIESTAGVAEGRMNDASESMRAAIDDSLGRASEAVETTRAGLATQSAAMLAMIEQGRAAIDLAGAEASHALGERLETIGTHLETLGSRLAAQDAAAKALIERIETELDGVTTRLGELGRIGGNETQRLSEALDAVRSGVAALGQELNGGARQADMLIESAQAVNLALDDLGTRLGSELPAALHTIEERSAQVQATVETVVPRVEELARSASDAASELAAAGTEADRYRDKVDAPGAALSDQIAGHRAALAEMLANVETSLGAAEARLRSFGEMVSEVDGSASKVLTDTGPELIEAMLRVREAANQAAERARDAISAIIPQSAAALAEASREAVTAAVEEPVQQQLGALSAVAEQALKAARTASERLTRQMLKIGETAAAVEARIDEERRERQTKDSETFSRRVALLIESLNSTAIDVTKIMSNEVTDSAWAAYLKGDRGIFTRRAVRLIDNAEAREIVRHYEAEPEFREQVNRYIHDFESMLRRVLADREGATLGVTLLSSDMGKLYVALAQAIERLR